MVSSLFWRYKIMKEIRKLRADEIEARVGIVKKKWTYHYYCIRMHVVI